MDVVDPRQYRAEVYIWFSFQTFTYASLLLLLLVNALAGIRRNRSLNVLKIVFIVTSICNSCLIWTGHAFSAHPPQGLCLFNAAAIIASTPMQAGAALALVIQVWSGVMSAKMHPPALLGSFMTWLGSDVFLLSLPFVFTVPMFMASLIVGRDGRAYRGSPFYCTIDDPVGTVTSIMGAFLTLIVLVLAAWTTVLISRTRWRVRTVRHSRLNYPLVIRTLVFCIFVAVAFVVGIISTATTFAAVIPDIVLGTTGMSLFFIFATNEDVLCLVCCCRKPHTFSSERATSSGARPSRSHNVASVITVPSADHAHELVAIPALTASRAAGSKSSQSSLSKADAERIDEQFWTGAEGKNDDIDVWLASEADANPRQRDDFVNAGPGSDIKFTNSVDTTR